MTMYFVELSKYILITVLSLYTFSSYLFIQFKKEGMRDGIIISQRIYLVCMFLVSFLTMYFKSSRTEYLILYGFMQVFFLFIIIFTEFIYPKCNRLLLNHLCCLWGIGIVIQASISLEKAERHLLVIAIAYLISLLVPLFVNKLPAIKNLTIVYAVGSFLLLLSVYLFAETTNGSKIIFSLGKLTFQPSELVKILFILFLASAMKLDTSIRNLIFVTLVAASCVSVLILSKDLGNGFLLYVTFVLVVFIATNKIRYLLLGFLASIGASIAAYYLFAHVRVRVLAWLDPFAYIDGKGYQITQSLFAIGSGNFFGLGLLGGSPSDIPYVETDFIFSAICEELGVIFGICLILVLINFFILILNTCMKAKENFYRLLAAGIAIILLLQTFLTIGGGIKFIPLTGVTLPFISYGGNSMVSCMILFSLAQAIYIKTKEEGGKIDENQEIRS